MTDNQDPTPLRSLLLRRNLFVVALALVSPLLIFALMQVRAAYPSVRLVLSGLIISLVFATAVGAPAQLIMPAIGPWCARQRFPLSWASLIVALLAITAVGSSVAVWVLAVLGIFRSNSFWKVVLSSLSLSAFISLIIGIAVYLYEGLKERLDRTTRALREKELEKERASKLAAEARLSALESRIHPHFLFNTLNSISSLIHEDPVRAERMIEQLAGLLRFSLDWSENVLLSQELKIVTDYLEIEKARFGNRLLYSIDVPENLGTANVPPFSIQTIVENSVKYAVATRRGGGLIEVAAREERERLVIEVCDDGPGFSEEEITSCHGLDNLRTRLAALFDDSGFLRVSRRDQYTVVSVSMPLTRIFASVRI